MAAVSNENSNQWVFTKEQLQNTPSRRCSIDYEKELHYRQQAATLIQDMGQRLQVTQLCINTAIVYVHRFYMFHSFTKFHRNPIAACALFLAAKVEEQPRKLEHVIRVAHMILFPNQRHLDVNSEQYQEQAQELINNENILLQTLGFEVAIDHPHTQVLKCCQHLFRASTKDMAQTSYFMATNSLHLTTMCLQYKPTVVACVCIHLVCKWFNYEIPLSAEGKQWFSYVDKTVTIEQLDELTVEFLAIFNKCPSRLRKRVMQQPGVNASAISAPPSSAMGGGSKEQDPSRVKMDPHGSSTASRPSGDRVPRPHDQRRDKSGAPLPTTGIVAGHRPSSNSGHPPSHSARPPEGSGHHHHSVPGGSSSSSHPGRPPHPSRPSHPHQRPGSNSNATKDVKPVIGGSNSAHLSSSSQQRLQQQPSSHPQQHSSSTQHQRKPSSQATPTGLAKVQQQPGSGTGSLFSPPRIEQERKSNAVPVPNMDSTRQRQPSASLSQDWPTNGGHNLGNIGGSSGNGSSAVTSQQQHGSNNLITSLGFSLDLDDICGDDQDSTWDINYNADNLLVSSPNAAIESMLNLNNAGGSSGSQQSSSHHQQPQQHHALFGLLEPSPKFNQPSQQQSSYHNTTPQLLPATPQPQIHTPSMQQQQSHHLQHHRESLFDLGIDNEPFSSSSTHLKAEDTAACVDIKSTPLAEVIVSATGGMPLTATEGSAEDSSVDPSSGKKKKKKKEKHKNKDKDREKEKKHKHKHKEKDKDRERSDKEKLKIVPVAGSATGEPAATKLKIKLPKDHRIEAEGATTANGSSASSAASASQAVLPAGGLKIKIISNSGITASNNATANLAPPSKPEKPESSRKRASTTSSSSLNRALPSAKVPKVDALQQQLQMQQQQQQFTGRQQTASGSQQQRPHHERNGTSTSTAGLVDERDNRQRSHATHGRSAASMSTAKVSHNNSSSSSSIATTATSMSNFSGMASSTGSQWQSMAATASTAAGIATTNPNAYRGTGNYPAFAPTYPPPPGPPMQTTQQHPPPIGPPFHNAYPPAYPYHMYQPYQAPMPMMGNHMGHPPPAMGSGNAGMPPLPRDPPPQVPPPPPPQTH